MVDALLPLIGTLLLASLGGVIGWGLATILMGLWREVGEQLLKRVGVKRVDWHKVAEMERELGFPPSNNCNCELCRAERQLRAYVARESDVETDPDPTPKTKLPEGPTPPDKPILIRCACGKIDCRLCAAIERQQKFKFQVERAKQRSQTGWWQYR